MASCSSRSSEARRQGTRVRGRVAKRRGAPASARVGARRLGLRLRGSALAQVPFRAVARTLAAGGECCAVPSLFFPHSARKTTRSCPHSILLLHSMCNSTRLPNPLPWVSQVQTTKRKALHPFSCNNKNQKRHWLWPLSLDTLVRQARRPEVSAIFTCTDTMAPQAADGEPFLKKASLSKVVQNYQDSDLAERDVD